MGSEMRSATYGLRRESAKEETWVIGFLSRKRKRECVARGEN